MAKRATTYKNAEVEAASKYKEITPLNDNQSLYINALKEFNQVVVCGYSGTGKTYVAATMAANMYSNKDIDKIIITRPNVSVGKDLGHLPGDLNEKFAPWAAPVLDVLTKQLGEATVVTAIKKNNIEMVPLSIMRGRSFDSAFIILDEAQNTTTDEIKMFLTRVGENCKVVINGDIKQSDIKGQSGLSKVMHLIKKNNMPVPVVEFTIDDIVRSDMCKQWIVAFEDEGL